jgi:metallo-beta-lactamase class B
MPAERWLLALTAFSLFGCATGSAPNPAAKPMSRLASDAVIDAAEQAAPIGWIKANRWNEPAAPFTIIGNVHYVGTATVSSFLITGNKGHVLIDGVVPQSAPQIIGNIKKLGYDIADVKYLLNSHAHIDHAGGLAGLQRASGAIMVASAADKPFLEAGAVDHGPTKGVAFPPVRVDRVIGDAGTVKIGNVTLTAHITPGHSPGCTSYSMDATGADKVRRRVFFHCSATVAGQSLVPEAYPGMVGSFRKTFAKLRSVKADIFLANHDNFFDLHAKRAKQIAGDANAFVDPGALGRFNAAMEEAFEGALRASEAKGGGAR